MGFIIAIAKFGFILILCGQQTFGLSSEDDDADVFCPVRGMSLLQLNGRGTEQLVETTAGASLLPSGACRDEPGFEDQLGSPCSNWVGYNCDHATKWGYSSNGLKELLENCKMSCEKCDAEAPTPPTRRRRSQTSAPTPAPTPTPAGCEDDPEFRDERGSPCFNWQGYDCESFPPNGAYSSQGQRELVENCKLSCGKCDAEAPTSAPTPSPTPTPTFASTSTPTSGACEDAPLFKDQLGSPCSNWATYNCEDATKWGYSSTGKEELIANCKVSCDSCDAGAPTSAPTPPPTPTPTPAPCGDDPAFKDELGSPCSNWIGYDCAKAGTWGYSSKGKEDLFAKCKGACGECGA